MGYKRKLSNTRNTALKIHRNKNKLNQRRKGCIEVQYFEPLMMKIPCEIFMIICTYLSPLDLFSLTRVCKKWKNWLVAPNNRYTQFIWKESRMMYMRYIKDPPVNVDEFKWYIKKWKKIPDWIHDCFFCFNMKAKKLCRYKELWVRVCRHCHNIYNRRIRKKVGINKNFFLTLVILLTLINYFNRILVLIIP
jgi:hypothetical protein